MNDFEMITLLFSSLASLFVYECKIDKSITSIIFIWILIILYGNMSILPFSLVGLIFFYTLIIMKWIEF